ncbi:hypothetical protein KAR91_66435 [Candidatus Pacearchaeota archaeon]|nr:hypothetical protein [Candidatus Pacearchaeota archaeon]
MNSKDQKERYRKSPIHGTDFSKRVSVLIEDIRHDLIKTRGRIHDLEFGTCWGDMIKPVEGLLTCGLISLAYIKKDIIKVEVKQDDKKFGKSLTFRSRGIGLDSCPGCFVCGPDIAGLLNNISAFVSSKEEGMEILTWFESGAFLDYRPHEPSWIQLKVGACNEHLPNLQKLHDITSSYGLIRKVNVKDAYKHIE